MLSERLRDLRQSGLVIHSKDPATGSSIYSLTAKGRSLGDLLHTLYDWGRLHAKEFDVNVGEPMKELAAHKAVSMREQAYKSSRDISGNRAG